MKIFLYSNNKNKNIRILIDSDEGLTKQGIKQGYGLFPTLFNIYINDIIREWKHAINKSTLVLN